MHGLWDSPGGKAIPTKTYKTSQQVKFHIGNAKKNSATKPTIKIIAGPRESKACNLKEKKSISILKYSYYTLSGLIHN